MQFDLINRTINVCFWYPRYRKASLSSFQGLMILFCYWINVFFCLFFLFCFSLFLLFSDFFLQCLSTSFVNTQYLPFGFGSAFVWNLRWSQQFSQNLFMLYSLSAQLLKVARYIQYIEILYTQELKVMIYILFIDYST